MTRYGGMGRTRPKKLTSKASIPIVREDQIDAIDEDVQSALQQVETGVEKAEESVRISFFFFASSLPDRIYVT
jgi:enhancer of polycomb-like protein